MKRTNILFIVQNSFYPRDTRVYNECKAVNHVENFKCFVFAPRNSKLKEKYFEIDEGVNCIRFPHYDSGSITSILLEYFISFFWFVCAVPWIVLFYRIKIIHVGNPPDFILPAFFWLKIFGVKFIFDQHDLSLEQFKIRVKEQNIISRTLLILLARFEKWSIELSNLVIATNATIEEYEHGIVKNKKTIIVRNSNKIQYSNIKSIPKKNNNKLHLGFIGSLMYHSEAGIESLRDIAYYLRKRNIDFNISIIGEGPGMEILENILKRDNLEGYFHFYGWMRPQNAFLEIINFDFGILPWTICESNNVHTAAKLMDYMCCAVPVCSLTLREQMRTTNKIGVHTETFEEMVDEIIKIYTDKKVYETLRAKTLLRFNKDICWEKQETVLINGYYKLLEYL